MKHLEAQSLIVSRLHSHLLFYCRKKNKTLQSRIEENRRKQSLLYCTISSVIPSNPLSSRSTKSKPSVIGPF
jgi:hypothetical protein